MFRIEINELNPADVQLVDLVENDLDMIFGGDHFEPVYEEIDGKIVRVGWRIIRD
ncbi:hypothetical protein [Crocosphaera sp.]|uniref:hypothetical protein n=1 Tax=Crocosphaera sp. TaxID=2729996 RepID=UPI003F1FB62C|nr:hypothetical protein [Crocosphaera sp.]